MSALAVAPVTRTGHDSALEIDLAAVAANVRLFVATTTSSLMAVVKADGFGHGAADVARTALAHGATAIGVTSIDEALALRAAGIRAPVLSWLNPLGAEFAAALAADIDVAVASHEHLDAVISARRSLGPVVGRARVHLHLDTGMARDGAEPSAWRALCHAARRAEVSGAVRVVGVMGHLGCADDPSDVCNDLGRELFGWGVDVARACGLRPAQRHLAATAAALTDRRTHHTMVRIGAGLVGIDPSGTTSLHRALTLTSPVVAVRRVRTGTRVGYGHTWTAPRATSLALLPVGYADGLPRAASGRAEVAIRGRRRPVVGRISMDQIVVDLGDEHVELGEIATVFGPGGAGEPTTGDWAVWAGTLEHEIVTGLGRRLHRRVTAAGATDLANRR